MTFTPSQLEERRLTLGASEIAAVVGLSPFRSVHDVYCDKLGITEHTPETLPQKRGRILEGALRDWFVEDTGLAVAQAYCFRHGTEPFTATPDGLVYTKMSDKQPCALLEIKTDFSFGMSHWGEDEDAIPEHYLCQVQWQLGVSNFDLCYVAVLRMGTFRIYKVKKDINLILALYHAGREFWKLVESKTPPKIDATDHSRDLIRSLFPENNGLIVQATDDAERWARDYWVSHNLLKKCEEAKKLASNNLCFEIGEGDGIETPLWRATHRKTAGRINWEAAARAAGVTDEDAEKYRGEGSRRFDFRLKKGVSSLPEPIDNSDVVTRIELRGNNDTSGENKALPSAAGVDSI